MIVLGLDPGIARTGFGVLDTAQSHSYVEHGCLATSPDLPPGRRLAILADHLNELVVRHRVGEAVMEQVFSNRNKANARLTAYVHGVFLQTLDQHRIPVHFVTPSEVKRHVTGQGFATKQQVQHAVTDQLNLAAIPTPDDAADALAVALSYKVEG